MSESNGGNPRLDRIEGILETIVTAQHDMQQEHQLLLRAQVVQGEEAKKRDAELRELSKRTDERFLSLAAALERMDAALTALMGTVDALVRRPEKT